MNARLLIASAAALCAVAGLASTASAQSRPRTARVAYADLNLASAAGRSMLERRIDAAAESICRQNGYVDLARFRSGEACHAAAVSDAMAQVMTAGAGHIQYASNEVSAEER